MHKNEAIEKLDKLIIRAVSLKQDKRFGDRFKIWKRDSLVTIGYIFGDISEHKKEFDKINYSLNIFLSNTPDYEFQEAYVDGLNTAIAMLKSMKSEISEFWTNESNNIKGNVTESVIDRVKLIINRFHQVTRQLRTRHSNRNTLEINDEYDVQDLFHALLKLYFDDIRAEEWTPSYAGASSRTDFLLKNEKIIIEIKKTRKSLKSKEIGEQLIVDSMRYQSHPDCNILICFVYDPERIIGNPKGIENDLTKEIDGISIYTYIRPE